MIRLSRENNLIRCAEGGVDDGGAVGKVDAASVQGAHSALVSHRKRGEPRRIRKIDAASVKIVLQSEKVGKENGKLIAVLDDIVKGIAVVGEGFVGEIVVIFIRLDERVAFTCIAE